MLFEWLPSYEVKPRNWRIQIQVSRKGLKSWRWDCLEGLFWLKYCQSLACYFLSGNCWYLENDLKKHQVHPLCHIKLYFLLFRLKRMSFVMKSRGWRQRRKSWSSNSKPWMHNLASCLPHLQSLLHLLLRKVKLLGTSWFLSLVILELPCGSSCHLQRWIPHRIMYSAPRLHKLATYTDLGLHFDANKCICFVIVLGCFSFYWSFLTGFVGWLSLYSYDLILVITCKFLISSWANLCFSVL